MIIKHHTNVLASENPHEKNLTSIILPTCVHKAIKV